MDDFEPRYSLPRLRFLQWLTATDVETPAHVRDVMLGELLTTPTAVLMAVINAIIVNCVALMMTGGAFFFIALAVDSALAILRLSVIRAVTRACAAGTPTPTDKYIITAILWAALQGLTSMVAMSSGNHSLEVLTTAMVVGVLGPLCARYFSAPRLAFFLFGLIEFPYVTGAAQSGDPWLLVLLLQTPFYIVGCLSIIKRFKVLCTTTLVTNYENERRAQHDALTGLLNRAGLACLYPPGAHIAGLAYTLFCIDLDGFKAVNDTYGHHIGDLLLQAVALRLRSCVKARDCVTRLGGDEFLILAHDLNAAEGAAFADRLIRHITDEPFVFAEGYPIHIGTSVGFACGPEDGDTIEGLTRKADDALYVAKQAGKSTFRRCAPVERPYFAKVS